MRKYLFFATLVGISSLVTLEAMAYQPGGFRQVQYVQPYPHQAQNYYWGRPPRYPYAYRAMRPQPAPAVRSVRSEQAVEQRAEPAGSVLDREDDSQHKPALAQSAAGGQSGSTQVDSKQTNQTKQAFLERLRPLVIEENRRLLKQREEVSRLFKRLDRGEPLYEQERQRLGTLAKRYRVKQDPLEKKAARADLLERIDIIPVSLALAQAATESGWGRSRFAREGKNLFGIWTYDESKGLVPKQRAKGKTHLVRKFESLGESLRYYMHNLNSHPAYADLRRIRAAKRNAGIAPDGLELAAGLEAYSAKGKEYIELIRRVIQQNDLALLDAPHPQA